MNEGSSGRQMGEEKITANGLGAATNDPLGVLADERRRYVLSYFRNTDDDVAELAELVGWVQAHETEREGGRRETVRIELHHNHLPKLADSSVIEYDARSGTVRYHGRAEHERMAALVDERGSKPDVGVEEEAAIEQLQEALRADDENAKNFHVREAMQLLQLAKRAAWTDGERANEVAE